MENKNVLLDVEQIAKAERFATRAKFAVYWRRLNTDNYKKELQSLEKIQRFLTNEGNQSHMEQSNMWKGMAQQVDKHVTEYTNAIELSKVKEQQEIALLEEVNNHIYGDGLYDKDYFTNLFVYAETMGDTSEYDTDLKLALKAHGFLAKDEVKTDEVKS